MSQILNLSWGQHIDILGGSCCLACYKGGGCFYCRKKALAKLQNKRTKTPKKTPKKKEKFYRGGQFLPDGGRAPIGGCTITTTSK